VDLRLQNRKPALVLVYGIPLRVGSAELTGPEKDLQGLAKDQRETSTSQA
jgi:hypothetical protein